MSKTRTNWKTFFSSIGVFVLLSALTLGLGYGFNWLSENGHKNIVMGIVITLGASFILFGLWVLSQESVEDDEKEST